MGMFDGWFGPSQANANTLAMQNPALSSPNMGLQSMFYGGGQMPAHQLISGQEALSGVGGNPSVQQLSASNFYGPGPDWSKALAGLGAGFSGAGKALSTPDAPVMPHAMSPQSQIPLSAFGSQQFGPAQINIMSLLNRRF